MKKGLFISLLILLVPTLCFAQKSNFQIIETLKNKPLKLIVEAEKNVYNVDDEIIFHFAVQNIAPNTTRFLRDSNPTHNNLLISSQNGKRCRIADSAQVMAGTNALVALKPREIFEYTLNGKIVQGKKHIARTRYKKDGYEEVSGIFIEFPTWSIYLEDGPGKYLIKARYIDGGWLLNPEKKAPSDLWRGTLFSEPIEVEIIK
jgi:hypothetical protein